MTNPRRVLIVTPYGFNDRMTNFIEFVTARLLSRNEYAVTALARMEGSSRVKENTICGVNVVRYCSSIGSLLILLRLFLSARPDVVHVHNARNNRAGFFAALLAKLFFIPLCFTEYGLLHNHYLTEDRDNPFTHPIKTSDIVRSLKDILAGFAAGRRHIIRNYMFNWSLTHADEVVFVSHHNIPIGKAIGLRKVRHLPQIVDANRWSTKEIDATSDTISHLKNVRAQLDLIRGERCVLFIGQMKERKGWDVFLRAIPLIPKEVIHYGLVVTASGNKEEGRFSSLIDELGIRDRIIFLGQIFDSALLAKVFEASTAVAVPSRYEGFGLVPLEAFEAGRPVVATNVLALREHLLNGKSALFVPTEDPAVLGEAIMRLVKDDDLKERLILGGRDTLARMKSHELHEEWLRFYEEIISNSKVS